MRIVMVGSGYVGLVSGACFSEFGMDTVCVDRDQGRIDRLKRGEIPIHEPGLDELVAKNTKAGRLSFTTSLQDAMQGADVVFIAVGTPSRRGDGHADLSYVYAAAGEIAGYLDGYTVVVTKSTVPVGTGREVERIIRKKRPDADFDVCSNPEFMREGAAITDFMRPDRIVIGAETVRARTVLKEVYRPLYLIETPVVTTTLEGAETAKYAANAFLATKITFINEMADFCEKVGADVQDIAKAMGLDGRIGRKFLHAGPGYGGSCFPKDTEALMRTAQECGSPLQLVEAVVSSNSSRKKKMAGRIIAACGGSVRGKTIAVLGVTFKPNTDDMREAPSLDIIPALQAAGATVRAYDPAGMDSAARLLPDVTWCRDSWEAVDSADAVAIITEWHEFRSLDPGRLRKSMHTPVMIDLRNIYKPDDMAAQGFDYYSIGRAPRKGFSGQENREELKKVGT
ncbi:MAG: UDP-glucose/GDP-mannose dehydrogenase family protein [Pseudomonadota bacterium]|nr:UDP-glucose/GDP-mannose dehydrogenase family protein [Pseudomonadota bacterium]